MKTKITFLIVVASLVTLSFTFSSVTGAKSTPTKTDATAQNMSKGPVGGLVYEEK